MIRDYEVELKIESAQPLTEEDIENIQNAIEDYWDWDRTDNTNYEKVQDHYEFTAKGQLGLEVSHNDNWLHQRLKHYIWEALGRYVEVVLTASEITRHTNIHVVTEAQYQNYLEHKDDYMNFYAHGRKNESHQRS